MLGWAKPHRRNWLVARLARNGIGSWIPNNATAMSSVVAAPSTDPPATTQAIGPPLREYVAFSKLGVDLVWTSEWFEILCRERPVGEILPKQLFVKRCSPNETPDGFWPSRSAVRLTSGRSRAQAKKKPRTPGEGLGGAMAHDNASCDSEVVESLFGSADGSEEEADGDVLDGATSSDGEALLGGAQIGGSDDEAASGGDSSSSSSSSTNDSTSPSSPSESSEQAEAGSSRDAAPGAAIPEPPPAAPRAPSAAQGPDGRSWVCVDMPPYGSIAHYKSNGNFVANCCFGRHCGRPLCKKTRTSTAPTTQRAEQLRPAQGRPLGLVCAWLVAQGEFGTKEEHGAFAPTLEQRRDARALLRNIAGAEELFRRERPKRHDEDSEPDLLA